MERTFERTRSEELSSLGENDLLKGLQASRRLSNRALRWAALNRLFRLGSAPHPAPSGDYAGEFLAIQVAPLLSPLLEAAASLWMSWRGKAFDPARQEGINILSRDSLPVAYLLWPLYRDYREDGPHVYRAFPFITYSAPGLTDPDRQVLKIDYNLDSNPQLSVRRFAVVSHQ
jgi:hypothetical protein